MGCSLLQSSSLGFIVCSGIDPVSYTHLDVYKRQIRNFAEEEIKPLAFLMDQNNEFPEEAVKKLGKLGWMEMCIRDRWKGLHGNL